jgi:hypothetical protein
VAFGTSGSDHLQVGSGKQSSRMARMLAGSLMVAGPNLGTSGGPLLVSKWKATGGVDNTFGDGGTGEIGALYFDTSYMFHTIGAQCDGKVLVGGRLDPDAGLQRVGVARLLPTGALDNGFGTAGIASLGAAIDPKTIPVGVAQDQATGKIVIVGRDGQSRPFVLRLNP